MTNSKRLLKSTSFRNQCFESLYDICYKNIRRNESNDNTDQVNQTHV